MSLPAPSLPQSWWRGLSRPQRFMQISARLLPPLGIISAVGLAAGLYLAWAAPPDYQQGLTVKIMFIHVPCAWLSMLCYTMMACSAAGILLWKHPLAAIALKTAAPIGAAFTLLALATGSIWGRPSWGTWWEWGDSRLFSMFILLLLYCGIIALSRAFDNSRTAAYAAAVLTLIGFIDIPIIKFSVEWWNSLHQPASILRKGGIAIAPAILIPLLVMAAAFTMLFFVLQLLAMRNEILRVSLRALQQKLAWEAEPAAVDEPDTIADNGQDRETGL
ncbi:heme ABC transporter permease [Candidatus Tokpelaia sp.]|uniref:heme ABC transporter permease n=1 Tax=Candidatus Tokpelaia sp. TaxID=2233777 RepID=UPI00123C1647|nr:heme ABC transporter permease [Candidatus Tokpelaia sp.]KAA6405388.1 heme transporter HemC [Candidatus Tokpelaia sp.]